MNYGVTPVERGLMLVYLRARNWRAFATAAVVVVLAGVQYLILSH